MAKKRANGEGSLYKRKDGTWTAQFTDNSGKKRYLYAKTQQQVKDKLKEALRMEDDGISANAGKITLAAWMREWLEVYIRPTVRPNTYAIHYRIIHLHIIPAFQRVALKDLREPMLQRFLNDKLQKRLDGKPGGYAASFCDKIKADLSCALNKAVDLGMIPRNPAARLRLPSYKSKEKQILTPEQQRQLEKVVTDGMKDDYSNGIFLLMLYTGLRIGEALGLQVSDIDFNKKELHIRRTLYRIKIPGEANAKIITNDPKTKTSIRTIPLSGILVNLLHELYQRREQFISDMSERWVEKISYNPQWAKDGYLFLSVHGKVFDTSTIKHRLEYFTDAAGVPRISPHALRHTFATRWIEAGLDIKSLSELLGHADAKMTLNVYTHSLPEQKRDGMDKLTASFHSG